MVFCEESIKMICQTEKINCDDNIVPFSTPLPESVFDIRGNFFCADCGAAYDVVPYQCLRG
jgi:hypothetical protein